MNQNQKSSSVVGIDLGTTNTVVSVMDDTGKPKTIPNKDGEMKTPSVVHVDPVSRQILVGQAAYNMQLLEPNRTFRNFKRDVGTDASYLLEGGLEVTPLYCQMQLLKYIRESLIDHFSDPLAGSKAVITVPAYFGEKERQSVKKSAEGAGIEVIALINEPTAAGLAHGLQEKQGDRLVVVIDFGGGTCDVSILSYQGSDVDVIASYGDKHLGGKDIDDSMVGLVREAFEQQHGITLTSEVYPVETFALLEEVQRQKHMLASRTEVKICASAAGKQVVVPLTRLDLERLTSSFMDRIENLNEEALRLGKVDRNEVDAVLVVGGSSRLVPFRDRVKRLYGPNKITQGQVSPDQAIAEGAAIHAAKIVYSSGGVLVGETLRAIPAPAIKYRDSMPHSLGVLVQDPVSGALFCSVILERNTPIPCKAAKVYSSVEDSQTRFKVTVIQGEDGQKDSDCLTVAERELNLPTRKTTEPSLDVSMGYDDSGMVNVTVVDRISGRTENITTDFYAKI